jgi:hypothetical protein
MILSLDMKSVTARITTGGPEPDSCFPGQTVSGSGPGSYPRNRPSKYGNWQMLIVQYTIGLRQDFLGIF